MRERLSIGTSRRAPALKPSRSIPNRSPELYFLNTAANIRLNKTAEAVKSSIEGVRIDQDHAFPDLQYMHGMLLISTWRQTGGRAQLLKSYLDIALNGDNADNAKVQLAK